ncbi:hypothetical protein BaRGS_00018897, partial [Batillaria attramentaria]
RIKTPTATGQHDCVWAKATESKSFRLIALTYGQMETDLPGCRDLPSHAPASLISGRTRSTVPESQRRLRVQ